MSQHAQENGGTRETGLARDPAGTIRSLMDRNKQAIINALPTAVKPEHFIRVALTAIQRNEGLLKADAWSLLGAIIEGAQSGLSLDPSRREAALVPFYNKDKKKFLVQFMPMYGGYIKKAHDSGKVSSIFARVVYENEPFDIQHGLDTTITHKPLPPAKRGEKRVGAYAVVHLKDGTVQSEFMYEDEIMEIRLRSKAKDAGPWKSDTDEMRKKTVIRRLAKFIPLSKEWTQITTRDEYREAGLDFPSDLEAESGFSEPPEGFAEPREIGEGSQEGSTAEVPLLEPKAARAILDSGAKKNLKGEMGSVNAAQLGKINVLLARAGYEGEERHGAVGLLLGVEVRTLKELSGQEASAVIDVLEGMVGDKK